MYQREEGSLVIVGSKGGAPEHPGWYQNLMAHPEASVEIAGDGGIEKVTVRAREAQGEERERILPTAWPSRRLSRTTSARPRGRSRSSSWSRSARGGGAGPVARYAKLLHMKGHRLGRVERTAART